MLFENLKIWRDVVPRSGAENMAIDQWLIESCDETPVLRFYDWDGDWVSLGYFQSLAEAREIFQENEQFVRRWTGGGIVDHRLDQTYTLAIPRTEELASARGSESYCAIHKKISECLVSSGVTCELTRHDSKSDSAACFENPVAWDLLGGDGAKLAGAGQRRTRHGILHQGSVAVRGDALERLGDFLSERCEVYFPEESPLWQDLVEKYCSEDWLSRVR